MKKVNWIVVIAGALVGLAAVLLTALGNPANMGFCIACFLRDIAGACGLHGAAKVQYVRPEIIGLVLGSFIMALVKGEFRAKGGSSPATRFVLGCVCNDRAPLPSSAARCVWSSALAAAILMRLWPLSASPSAYSSACSS